MDTTQMFKMMKSLNRQKGFNWLLVLAKQVTLVFFSGHSCHCIYNLASGKSIPLERSSFSYDFEAMIAFSGVDIEATVGKPFKMFY